VTTGGGGVAAATGSFAGETGVAAAGVVGVGAVTGGVGVPGWGEGARGGEVGSWGGAGPTLGDGVWTMRGPDRLEMTTAALGASLGGRTTGFGFTVRRTGGFGVGSTILSGAETGWSGGEASNAARQK
jgi:hypothetical protein